MQLRHYIATTIHSKLSDAQNLSRIFFLSFVKYMYIRHHRAIKEHHIHVVIN